MNLENKLIDTARTLFDLPTGRFKHFSFICKRNRIVSVGWNKAFKTHPVARKFHHRFSCIHSELDCLNNFPYKIGELSYYKFYNMRLYKDKRVALSKPCLHCQYMLSSFNVKKVYYSTPENFCILEI